MNFLKKYWLPLLIVAGFLVWLFESSNQTAQNFQNWLKNLIGQGLATLAELAAALLFFWVLGIALLELEIPLIIVVAIIVLVTFVVYKVWGWFGNLWNSLFGGSSANSAVAPASPTAASAPATGVVTGDPFSSPGSTNNGLLSFPPGTVDNGDGTVTLPDGSVQQLDEETLN